MPSGCRSAFDSVSIHQIAAHVGVHNFDTAAFAADGFMPFELAAQVSTCS